MSCTFLFEAIMTDPTKESAENQPGAPDREPPSPDDLVHMYGGSLFFIAIPLVLIALLVYFFFIR
jgi:hypothetical protein